MVDYMEILRLSSDPKNSQRCIASIVHSSRHTIRDVLEAAKKAGVSWPLDDTVTNEMLKRILFPEKSTAETLYTQPDYPYIHKELARPGVNLTLLWTELQIAVPNGRWCGGQRPLCGPAARAEIIV